MKRFENFNNNSVSKKPKIQNNDNFWDEDLDIQEVDECLTQIETQCQSNVNSTTYDNFKTNANQCSTQAFLMPSVPSSSKNFKFRMEKSLDYSQVSTASVTTVIGKNVTPQEFQKKLLDDIKKLEEQNKKLTEQYKTKDGEISILRMQLKQAQKTADTEKMQKMQQIQKTQQQWSEKYNEILKEKDNVKNERDLKQLEIINLREKLRDLNFKIGQNHNDTLVNNLTNCTSAIKKSKRASTLNNIIPPGKKVCSVQTESPNSSCAISSTPLSYPLQQIIPNSFFDNQKLQHLEVMTLHNCNSRTLKSNSTQYENVIDFQALELSKSVISTEYFYKELVTLMNFNKVQLDSENATSHKPHINKIIFVTKHLLKNALEKLQKIEENIKNEYLRHMNEQYLYGNLDRCHEKENYCIFSRSCWSEDELLIELRRSISVLAIVASYNSYLLQLLTNQQYKNNVNNINTISQIIDSVKENDEKCSILNQIYEAVKIIGKIRRAHQFSGFLSSVLLLITNLIKSRELSTNCYDILHLIFQQIVFSRPSMPVLEYMVTFLRNASFSSYFLQLLCKNSKETSFRQSKVSFNFTQETCTFQVLIVLLETYRQNVNFIYEVFSFLINALRTNSIWFNSQENIRCQCLCRFCTTAIDLLYRLMCDFKEKIEILNSTDFEIYSSLFEIGLNILNILSYRYIDAILDSFQTLSQNLILITNITDLNKNFNYNSNQEIIQEALLSSVCNNELSEEEIFGNNKPEDNYKITSMMPNSW